MELGDEIGLVEARLRAAGVPVAHLLQRAGLARSTWDRWRRGQTEPNLRSWRAVERACAELTADADDSMAKGAA